MISTLLPQCMQPTCTPKRTLGAKRVQGTLHVSEVVVNATLIEEEDAAEKTSAELLGEADEFAFTEVPAVPAPSKRKFAPAVAVLQPVRTEKDGQTLGCSRRLLFLSIGT